MSFGLGRGLESLIPNKKPTRPAPVAASTAPTEIELSAIVPNPYQPRKRFSTPELEDLAASIKMHGILEPLVVSPDKTPGRYILIAGERRLRAAELAGLKKVPIAIRPTDNQEKLELALVENIQRQDLNPLEEAKALRKLLRDFNLSQNEVAKRVGRSRPTVTNTMRLLELAQEVQQALLENRISAGHARAILACSSHPKQVSILQQIESLHLSVRDTERLAQREAKGISATTSTSQRATTELAEPDPETSTLARRLSARLGTKVQIVRAPKGGRIVVEYYSNEERDRIADELLDNDSALSRAKSQPAADFTV